MAKNIRYYSNSAFPLPQRRDANDALKAAGAGPARRLSQAWQGPNQKVYQ